MILNWLGVGSSQFFNVPLSLCAERTFSARKLCSFFALVGVADAARVLALLVQVCQVGIAAMENEGATDIAKLGFVWVSLIPPTPVGHGQCSVYLVML